MSTGWKELDEQTAWGRIMRLERAVLYAQYAYYVLASPRMSDMQFDKLWADLENAEAQWPGLFSRDSVRWRVGSDIKSAYPEFIRRQCDRT